MLFLFLFDDSIGGSAVAKWNKEFAAIRRNPIAKWCKSMVSPFALLQMSYRWVPRKLPAESVDCYNSTEMHVGIYGDDNDVDNVDNVDNVYNVNNVDKSTHRFKQIRFKFDTRGPRRAQIVELNGIVEFK